MFVHKGNVIDYQNQGDQSITYNTIVNLTTRIGIAGEIIEPGAFGSVSVVGVYELPAINTAAFAIGDALYWDPTVLKLTNVSAENIPAGWATEPKLLAGTTARVKIG